MAHVFEIIRNEGQGPICPAYVNNMIADDLETQGAMVLFCFDWDIPFSTTKGSTFFIVFGNYINKIKTTNVEWGGWETRVDVAREEFWAWALSSLCVWLVRGRVIVNFLWP